MPLDTGNPEIISLAAAVREIPKASNSYKRMLKGLERLSSQRTA